MEEKARKFAVRNSTNYFTRDGLYSILYIMIIFGALCLFVKPPFCALPMAFAAVYILWLFSMHLWARNEFKTRYLISAEATLFISLFLLTMASAASIANTGSFTGSIMMVVGRCLEEILCVALTVTIVGWSCYDKRKKVLFIALNIAAAAGIIALLVLVIYDNIAHPEKEMGKVVPLTAAMSYVLGVDGFIFVKYFYSKKYDITEDENGDSSADKLFEEKLEKSTIGYVIWSVIFAAVIIFVRIKTA